MGTVYGTFQQDGVAPNGATVKIWLKSQYGSRPAKGTAPVGTPVASTVTTTAAGGDGQYVVDGIAAGDYYVSVESSGATVWQDFTVPGAAAGGGGGTFDPSLAQNITGAWTFSQPIQLTAATATPQSGLLMGGRDITGVYRIISGPNQAGGYDMRIGAGSATNRGTIQVNWDVGEVFEVWDGRAVTASPPAGQTAYGRQLIINEGNGGAVRVSGKQSAHKLQVQQGPATSAGTTLVDVWNIDTVANPPAMQVLSGTVISGYSDAYTTQTFVIDSADGRAQIRYAQYTGRPTLSAPAVAPVGSARIYYDSDLNQMRLSKSGAGYVDMQAGGGGGTGNVNQGGNAFAATMVLGTTDAFNLSLITNNIVRATIDTAGVVTGITRIELSGTAGSSAGIRFMGTTQANIWGTDDGWVTASKFRLQGTAGQQAFQAIVSGDTIGPRFRVTYDGIVGFGTATTSPDAFIQRGGVGVVKISNTAALVTSATAAAIATGGTITTNNVGAARVAPTANATGVIMQAGTVDGQLCYVINESGSFTVQMAAAGTSNVADGTGTTIGVNRKESFIWDAALSRWYR